MALRECNGSLKRMSSLFTTTERSTRPSRAACGFRRECNYHGGRMMNRVPPVSQVVSQRPWHMIKMCFLIAAKIMKFVTRGTSRVASSYLITAKRISSFAYFHR